MWKFSQYIIFFILLSDEDYYTPSDEELENNIEEAPNKFYTRL